ncbi:MAG TPA: HAD-IA family hydrolase [Rubricoccaceae bacterium]|jgi:HAD superfamily hydrolase (TIGR01509 family)
MALAALLLDLDGTLVDSNAAHTEAMVRAAADLGVTVPADRIDLGIGKGGDLLSPDLFGPAFEAEHGEAFRDGAGRHFAHVAAREPLQTFDGAAALIDAARVRGLRLALASSAAAEDLDATFNSTGLDLRERVDVVTTSSDAEASKPEPDLLLVAAEKLGVPPGACALVGDTVFDAEAARRAGVAFIGLATWRASEEELKAAGACATFASTVDLVAGLDSALDAASPGEHALTDDVLEALMDTALGEARAALDAGNAPIGAVVARADGSVLARSRNCSTTGQDRLRHAETEALHALGGAVEPGAVLVTTLEPCAMCLGAAAEAGVHVVVYALEAPLNGAAGRLLPTRAGGQLPLVACGPKRQASLALVREAAAAGDGFASHLLESLDG